MRLIVSRIALYVVTAIIAITINFFLSVSEGPRDEVVYLGLPTGGCGCSSVPRWVNWPRSGGLCRGLFRRCG